MAIIVTYDVPERHVELKGALFAWGYKDHMYVFDNNDKYRKMYLPNTTLYHQDKSPAQGRDDVQAVCNALGIELARCIATVLSSDWAGVWGKPFG